MAPWSIRVLRRLTLFLAFAHAFQFRLVIVLASDREPLTSDESAPVLTLPSGLPGSPPVNLQAVALDANRISISWDPPHYPNGPLVSYSLNIQEASSRNADSYQGSQVRLLRTHLPFADFSLIITEGKNGFRWATGIFRGCSRLVCELEGRSTLLSSRKRHASNAGVVSLIRRSVSCGDMALGEDKATPNCYGVHLNDLRWLLKKIRDSIRRSRVARSSSPSDLNDL